MDVVKTLATALQEFLLYNKMCVSFFRVINIQPLKDPQQNKSTTVLSTVSEITSKTKLSSVSELSSGSEGSDASIISSSSRRIAKPGRLLRMGRTTLSKDDLGSGSGLQSGLSLRSSLSSLSDSRSGRSSHRSGAVSVTSGTLRSETTAFVKSSYLWTNMWYKFHCLSGRFCIHYNCLINIIFDLFSPFTCKVVAATH